MKYLVMWCSPLNDAWEADADREPIGMTDTLSDYGKYLYNENRGEAGYEIYKLNMANLFVKMTDEEVQKQIRKESK